MKQTFPLFALALAGVLAGCSATEGSFETPNTFNEALLKDTESDVAKEFMRKPAAQFPPHIAIARLAGDEEREERRYYYQRSQSGIDALDLRDTPKHLAVLEELRKQPGIGGAATVNSLILPKDEPSAIKAIRKAAAKIHADMALVYIVNSGRTVEDEAPFVSFITLGLAPLQKINANASVAAVLIDVRTGYTYGVLSAVADEDSRNIGWFSRSESKALRIRAENAAMDKLIASIPGSIKGVTARYGNGKAPAVVVLEGEPAVSK